MVYSGIYAVIGMPVIGMLGFAGVLLPSVLTHFFPKYKLTTKLYFSLFNGIAAGLILAVGYIHSIPDSFEQYGDWVVGSTLGDQYAWPTFIALVATIMTFTVEEFAETLSSRLGLLNLHSHGQPHHSPPTAEDEDGVNENDEDDNEADEDNEDDANEDKDETKETDESSGSTEIDIESQEEVKSPEQKKKKKKKKNRKGKKKKSKKTETISSQNLTESHDSNGDAADTNGHTNGTSTHGDDIEAGKSKNDDEPKEIKPQNLVDSTFKPLTKMLILFIGLFFHNVFVGVALGIADEDRTLFLALIFHQFFEGVGLGSRVALANFKKLINILVVDTIFALEAPVGIAIGLIAKSQLQDGSKTYGLVDGTCQGISGGILIYISLVHMMRAYYETGATGWNLEYHRWVSWSGFMFGAAIMAVIGIWA